MKRATLGLVASIALALPAAASAHGVPPPATPNPVIQWNRTLLGLLRTPGQQPATVHPTRGMALVHIAVLDAVAAAGHRRFARAAAGVHTSLDDVAGRALGRAVARFDLNHMALGVGFARRR